MRSLLSTERLEDIDGRLAVTDEDSCASGVRYMKFWVDDAPTNPIEGRSPVGEEAPSRASPHHVGIPPFPNLSARDISRVPTSPERRDRPPQDQGVQDRSYGHGSPDFGGGAGDLEIANTPSIFTNSISSIDTHQCHTTTSIIYPAGIEDDIRVLMNHSYLNRLNPPISSLQTIHLMVRSSEPLLGGA